MNRFVLLFAALALVACNNSSDQAPASAADTAAAVSKPAPVAAPKTRTLSEVLADQPEETKARYAWRHPAETLNFFGIKPGMTVVEALPGGGWYSKILLDYLGPKGCLVGTDYAEAIWPLFGFFPDEFIEKKKTWVADWTEEAQGWRGHDSAEVKAFVLGSMPGEFTGTADAVLFIRALHNLNRFESQGGFLTAALADAHRALKPGGVLGVVQHHASDAMSEEFADGSHGYLKKDALIAGIEAAGFEFVDSSDINANPADQPGETDVVWRLPPTLMGSGEDPALKAKLTAVGESNRMTLKFRKAGV